MSIQGVVKRYALIIEKVTQCHFPTLDQIHRFLRLHGFEVSKRTLQRDIAGIALEFGVSLRYDRTHRGYVIDRDAGANPDIFIRFFSAIGQGRTTSPRDTIKLHEGFRPSDHNQVIENQSNPRKDRAVPD
ncbi:MAG TPA: hypothetical protein PLP29_19505 [Candidatus Ozemobacteraceae bacterium]|nr:hypothetical protein [Candidatus Ozemobacteraceae bacterium]